MKIMFCGASDTRQYLESFISVIDGFDAEHSSFLDATHIHDDVLTGTSVSNSRSSVNEADMCVFP